MRPALLALVEPQERGDPMSPLRWTTMSTRKLAAALTAQGAKTLEGRRSRIGTLSSGMSTSRSSIISRPVTRL
ncbi:hypothetical protein GCM10010468_04960 [Actinocorallia longicatena]|uniref:Uncharacterized protein n=1 Tax=Actinocorallia longicatena TaxID=111803 RepID=A0ABP6PY55_9ACTN